MESAFLIMNCNFIQAKDTIFLIRCIVKTRYHMGRITVFKIVIIYTCFLSGKLLIMRIKRNKRNKKKSRYNNCNGILYLRRFDFISLGLEI